jgi:ribosomal protein L11 methyltransferase
VLYLTVLTRSPDDFTTHYPVASVTAVESWEYKWMDDYDGGLLIPGVFIRPSDKAHIAIPKYVDTVIELDPRDAFGDGRHPTTRLCARLIRDVFETYSPKSVIDIGTGTGILAILAEKWGAGVIDAVDIEPLSVIKTKENCERNNCHKTRVFERNIVSEAPKGRYDLVIANILTGVIEESINHIMAACKPGGVIVFSGIGKQWRGPILDLFMGKGLSILTCQEQEGWLGIKALK